MTDEREAARRRWPGAGALVALALGGAGCLDAAEGRAARDVLGGQADAHGLRVEIEGGLGAVRALDPGALRLWAQAPALRIHLEASAGAGGDWVVAVDNVLPDAALVASTAGGAPVPLVEEPVPLPNRRRYRLTLPEGSEVVLTLEPPDARRDGPFRFAVFGDVQEAIGRVQDIYRRIAADPTLRFGVVSGDLTEMGSPAQLERFERELGSLPIPCFATLGNHDLGTSDVGFHALWGRGNLHFVFRGVHFTLLDSASATIAPRVYGWLDDWLSAGRDAIHVVDMHIPPIDPAGTRNGSFASRGEAGKLLSLLGRGRVDLTLYGHVHSYVAFENAGIPAFISGGGGAIPERLDGIGRHFLAVTVDPVSGLVETALVRVD